MSDLPPEFDSPQEQWVDLTLRDATSQLRGQLADVEPPPFRPRSSGQPRLLVAAAALVVLIGGAMFLSLRGDGDDGLQTADDPPTSELLPDSSDATSPTTDSPNTVVVPGTSLVDQPMRPLPEVPILDFSNLVTGIEGRQIQGLPRPQVGETVVDPAFGTSITRVTDAQQGWSISPQVSSPWNADETLLLLFQRDAEGSRHVLIDTNTLATVAELDINPSDIEQIFWSTIDASVFYYFENASLMSFDVDTMTATAVHTFEGCDRVGTGSTPVSPSADGLTFGVLCEQGDNRFHIAFRLDTRDEQRTSTTSTAAPVPTMSGRNFVVMQPTGQATVLTAELQPTGIVLPIANDGEAGFEVAVDNEGNDVVIATSFDIEPFGTIVIYDVATGETRTAIGEANGYPYPPPGNHIGRPGNRRSSLAVVGIERRSAEPGAVLAGEVVLVDLSTSSTGDVRRLAHHRSEGVYSDDDGYWANPFAAMSPTGSKVVFSSDWGSDSVNTYLIDLTR
jgi:hypothetical protein